MLKTFIVGIILGIAAAATALYAYPAVDQHREASIVAVAPNGGNIEAFHVNVPMDRIMVGAEARAYPLPEGMEWPEDEMLSGVRVELFKFRNARDVVIGVASRTSANVGGNDIIDWVLHFPARGSLYVSMPTDAVEGGYRQGAIQAGSREFAPLNGFMTERWIADETSDKGHGRLELLARYVGQQVEEEPLLEDELPAEEEAL